MLYRFKAEERIKVGELLLKSGVSKSLIRKAKRTDGGITVRGVTRFTNEYIDKGEEVVLLEAEKTNDSTAPVLLDGIGIIYQDRDIIVYDKPFGMPCHESLGHTGDTLSNFHAYITHGEVFRCINRLDRDTSGCCLVARSACAAHRLSGNVRKLYTAVCEGHLAQKEGVIEIPIKRENDSIIKRTCAPDGQYAKTSYRVIAQNDRYTLCDITLATGRTHQIRVHFAHIGHPLAGDDMYGGSREDTGRQALHCSRLEFTDSDGKAVTVSSPLPEDMKRLMY